MTEAEFQEFAESEEGKALINGYVSKAGYKSAEEIAGLERKKDELLGKVSKSQKDKAALTELFDKYGIVDTEDLGGKLATLAGSESKLSDFDKLQREIEIIKKSAKEAQDKADREKALRASSEKKAQIVQALKGAHVNDDSIDVLLSYFSEKAKVEEDGTGKINLIVDSDDGSSPFSSFVEEWSKTEQAKQFIKAPGNSGAGSGGPGRGGSYSGMTLEQIAEMPDRNERLKAMAELGNSG
jgi:hypothetical protein